MTKVITAPAIEGGGTDLGGCDTRLQSDQVVTPDRRMEPHHQSGSSQQCHSKREYHPPLKMMKCINTGEDARQQSKMWLNDGEDQEHARRHRSLTSGAIEPAGKAYQRPGGDLANPQHRHTRQPQRQRDDSHGQIAALSREQQPCPADGYEDQQDALITMWATTAWGYERPTSGSEGSIDHGGAYIFIGSGKP